MSIEWTLPPSLSFISHDWGSRRLVVVGGNLKKKEEEGMEESGHALIHRSPVGDTFHRHEMGDSGAFASVRHVASTQGLGLKHRR